MGMGFVSTMLVCDYISGASGSISTAFGAHTGIGTGPRKGGSIQQLSKLKPVFAQNGCITAGNASQTSDGAAFVLLMSEKMVDELKIKPIAVQKQLFSLFLFVHMLLDLSPLV